MNVTKRAKRSINPYGQLSWKFGPHGKDPFEAEDALKTIQPLPYNSQQEKQLAEQVFVDKHTGGTEKKRDQHYRAQALLGYQAKKQLKTHRKQTETQINDQFAKDFQMWLLGKDPTDPYHPAYIKNKLKELGVKHDYGPIPDPVIADYMGGFIDKKSAFLKKIALLKAGPNKYFKWTLGHYLLYYKYILRGLPYPEDQMLAEFDQYFPDLNGPRAPAPVKLTGWKNYNILDDKNDAKPPQDNTRVSGPRTWPVETETPAGRVFHGEYSYGWRFNPWELTWGKEPYICNESLDFIGELEADAFGLPTDNYWAAGANVKTDPTPMSVDDKAADPRLAAAINAQNATIAANRNLQRQQQFQQQAAANVQQMGYTPPPRPAVVSSAIPSTFAQPQPANPNPLGHYVEPAVTPPPVATVTSAPAPTVAAPQAALSTPPAASTPVAQPPPVNYTHDDLNSKERLQYTIWMQEHPGLTSQQVINHLMAMRGTGATASVSADPTPTTKKQYRSLTVQSAIKKDAPKDTKKSISRSKQRTDRKMAIDAQKNDLNAQAAQPDMPPEQQLAINAELAALKEEEQKIAVIDKLDAELKLYRVQFANYLQNAKKNTASQQSMQDAYGFVTNYYTNVGKVYQQMLKIGDGWSEDQVRAVFAPVDAMMANIDLENKQFMSKMTKLNQDTLDRAEKAAVAAEKDARYKYQAISTVVKSDQNLEDMVKSAKTEARFHIYNSATPEMDAEKATYAAKLNAHMNTALNAADKTRDATKDSLMRVLTTLQEGYADASTQSDERTTAIAALTKKAEDLNRSQKRAAMSRQAIDEMQKNEAALYNLLTVSQYTLRNDPTQLRDTLQTIVEVLNSQPNEIHTMLRNTIIQQNTSLLYPEQVAEKPGQKRTIEETTTDAMQVIMTAFQAYRAAVQNAAGRSITMTQLDAGVQQHAFIALMEQHGFISIDQSPRKMQRVSTPLIEGPAAAPAPASAPPAAAVAFSAPPADSLMTKTVGDAPRGPITSTSQKTPQDVYMNKVEDKAETDKINRLEKVNQARNIDASKPTPPPSTADEFKIPPLQEGVDYAKPEKFDPDTLVPSWKKFVAWSDIELANTLLDYKYIIAVMNSVDRQVRDQKLPPQTPFSSPHLAEKMAQLKTMYPTSSQTINLINDEPVENRKFLKEHAQKTKRVLGWIRRERANGRLLPPKGVTGVD